MWKKNLTMKSFGITLALCLFFSGGSAFGCDQNETILFFGLLTGKQFSFNDLMTNSEMEEQSVKSELNGVSSGVVNILTKGWKDELFDIYGQDQSEEIAKIVDKLPEDDPRMLEKLMDKQKGDIAAMKKRLADIEDEKKKLEEESKKPENNLGVDRDVFEAILSGEETYNDVLETANYNLERIGDDLKTLQEGGYVDEGKYHAIDYDLGSDVLDAVKHFNNAKDALEKKQSIDDLDKKEAEIKGKLADIEKERSAIMADPEKFANQKPRNLIKEREDLQKDLDGVARKKNEIAAMKSEAALKADIEAAKKVAAKKMEEAAKKARDKVASVKASAGKVDQVKELAENQKKKRQDDWKKYSDLINEKMDLENRVKELENAHAKLGDQLNKY